MSESPKVFISYSHDSDDSNACKDTKPGTVTWIGARPQQKELMIQLDSVMAP